MRILELMDDDEKILQQAAALLVIGFKENWPNAWPTMDSAIKEVKNSFGEDRVNRIAVNEKGFILGWIGAVKTYRGNVWAIHPLIVRPDQQKQGIGRALIYDIENIVRELGGHTLWAGSDDENSMTSLSNTDLYTNLPEKIANIQNLKEHPYEFYQKMGFTIVGVLPDANGIGKPDIFLAKRISKL